MHIIKLNILVTKSGAVVGSKKGGFGIIWISNSDLQTSNYLLGKPMQYNFPSGTPL